MNSPNSEEVLQKKIAWLEAELALCKAQRQPKLYKLPIEVGKKYGGVIMRHKSSIRSLPFLDVNSIQSLSYIVRDAMLPRGETCIYTGERREKLKRLEDFTQEECKNYTSCIDEVLAILQKYQYKEAS